MTRCSSEMKAKQLRMLDKLVEKSKLTEEDVDRIGHKIKRAIRKRLEKEIKCKN